MGHSVSIRKVLQMIDQDMRTDFLRSLEGLGSDLDEAKYPATSTLINSMVTRLKLEQSETPSAFCLETAVTDMIQTVLFMETRLAAIEQRPS